MKNRIGIIGGGQLGRMLTFAAKRLGFFVTILDPTKNSPAGQVADKQIVAQFNNEMAIIKLAEQVDFLTYEIELANASILEKLSQKGVIINPTPETLTMIKDKFLQKQFLKKNNIPTAQFIKINSKEEIKLAADILGYPIFLKARFDAYDGRGNSLIKKESDIASALRKLAGRKLYVEQYIPFKKELSCIIARNTNGDIAIYPIVETIHKDSICHIVIAPGRFEEFVAKRASQLAQQIMQYLKGAGVFGIEMFLSKNNEVIINEIAPRVHNTGHFTIEACATSQFEQHIRAITNLPLGNTNMITPAAVMINILGDRNAPAQLSGLENVLTMSNVFLHIYGKIETRKQRKMGHITVIDKSIDAALVKAKKARALISI